MRHRHWLLIAAGIALFYAFVFIRPNIVLRFYPSYGEHDITGGVIVAVACLLAWVVLEVVHFRAVGWAGKCECGYSLKGVKCPECGKDLGSVQL
jgi:hypothetical protein